MRAYFALAPGVIDRGKPNRNRVLTMDILASTLANIYSAPLDPDKWTIVLDDLARISNAKGAALLVERGDGWVGWRTSAALEPHLSKQILAHLDTRMAIINARLKAANSVEFVPDHQLFDDAEWLATPFMKEYGIPNGLKHTAGTFISLPSGDKILIFVIRELDSPRFSEENIYALNELRPHLARAAMLTISLGLTKIETMVDTIEKISQPAFVVEKNNCRIIMRRDNAAISNFFLEEKSVGIQFRDRTQRQSLRSIITATISERRSMSLPIKSNSGDRAVMHIMPIESFYVGLFDMRSASSEYFQHSHALIYLSLVRPEGDVSSTIIEYMFDLTNAESRVTESIASGKSIDETAFKLKISRETVRTHLKRVYSKLGVNRQAQLVSLVSGISKTGGNLPSFG